MIIITAVGSDRPGMAHAVAATLAEAGCNVEDTTMTRLSGEFAMILVVSPPSGVGREELMRRLAPLEASHGLFINCREFTDEEIFSDVAQPRYILSVYGPDKVGLLANTTGVLAAHGVNITDVQTRVASAGQAYVMIFEIEVPAELSVETLVESLEAVAQEIGVQFSLRPLEEDVL